MGPLAVYEVVGIIASVAGALVAYLRSRPDARGQNAAFVSLLGVIFTMLFALRFDALPKISAQLSLERAIDAMPSMKAIVERLPAADKAIHDSNQPMMAYVIASRIASLDEQLDEVGKGQFTVEESEMPEFALRLIESPTKSFTATSYVQFREWWDKGWGKRYEAMNIENVQKRHVTTERTFIFSDTSEMRAAEGHLREQARGGIRVRIAYARDLAGQITSDMVIVDGRLAGELKLTPDKGMKEAQFFTSQRDIDRIQRAIDNVNASAEEYRPR